MKRNGQGTGDIIETGYGEGIHDGYDGLAKRDNWGGFAHQALVTLSLSFLMLVGSLYHASVAHADVPLTPAHSCHYYDPAQSGQGFDLRVLPATDAAPARVFAALYVGAIPEWFRWHPSWFSVQGEFAEGDGLSQTFGVYEVSTELGDTLTPVTVDVGQIRLTATSDTTLVAEVRLDADSGFSPPAPPILATFNLRCLIR